MKVVPIKTQERIMRIPLINAANLFICIYNLRAVPMGRKNESKLFPYLFGYSMPAALVYATLYRTISALIPVLVPLVYAMGMYMVPLVMGYGLIQFQKKYMFTDTDKKEENSK
jgi:hypothetical protein